MGQLVIEPPVGHDESEFEYGISAVNSTNISVWQDSNMFLNLVNGVYKAGARYQGETVVLSTATLFVNDTQNVPYENNYNTNTVTINQATHGKNKVTNVMLFDTATGFGLVGGNWIKGANEAITINFPEATAFTVRIS